MNNWKQKWNAYFHQPQHERIRAWDSQIKKLDSQMMNMVIGYFFEFITIIAGIGLYECITPKTVLPVAIFANVMGIVLSLGIVMELSPVMQPGNRKVYEFCEVFPMEPKAVFQVRLWYLLKKIRNRGILLTILYGTICLLKRELDIILALILLYSLLFSALQIVREIRYKK